MGAPARTKRTTVCGRAGPRASRRGRITKSSRSAPIQSARSSARFGSVLICSVKNGGSNQKQNHHRPREHRRFRHRPRVDLTSSTARYLFEQSAEPRQLALEVPARLPELLREFPKTISGILAADALEVAGKSCASANLLRLPKNVALQVPQTSQRAAPAETMEKKVSFPLRAAMGIATCSRNWGDCNSLVSCCHASSTPPSRNANDYFFRPPSYSLVSRWISGRSGAWISGRSL